MNQQRINELRTELNAETISLDSIAEIETAFSKLPSDTLRDDAANATAGDMLDELEADSKTFNVWTISHETFERTSLGNFQADNAGAALLAAKEKRADKADETFYINETPEADNQCRCPNCGDTEDFTLIAATIETEKLYIDGDIEVHDVTDAESESAWEFDDIIQCNTCDHKGLLYQFSPKYGFNWTAVCVGSNGEFGIYHLFESTPLEADNAAKEEFKTEHENAEPSMIRLGRGRLRFLCNRQ